MTTPLPLCVIGGGVIGLRHAEVSAVSPRIELTAIVEPDETRQKDLRDMGLPVVTSVGDVPDRTRAAIVATPTPAHLASTRAALERGWPVIAEKPLAETLDAARALIAAAEAADLPLFTGHHRRCHPFSLSARDALGQIGAPVGVQGLWSLRKHDTYYDVPWRTQPGAGPLLTNLSHEIDLLGFLFGRVTEATALISSARRGFEIEDSAAISLRFDNGALGSFLMSDAGASPWAFEAASGENPAIAASGEDYLRFVGTEGALAFPSLTFWGRSAPGEIEWSKPLRRREGQSFDRVDPLLEQIERFARVVAGGADDVLCTGQDGLDALEMTLAVALSARQGAPVARGAVPGDYSGV
ncbi:Gfo/Idh/MocA family protein [Marimonas lutisalis]|uniref:Gfo/Idh/MocA family protein n=1 Tax=Marimonas lutisalis TaxID=2545756 RepID=UPI001F214EB4|nr:Gfo/Idh/MocA family oxidoreductase [Marimonas lutisalis]